MTTTDRTTAELADTVKRIWRHSFQAELDSALEQRLRAQALVGVKAALEAAICRGATHARCIRCTARCPICGCQNSALAIARANGTF